MFTLITVILEIIYLGLFRPISGYAIPDVTIFICIAVSTVAFLTDLFMSQHYRNVKIIIILGYFVRLAMMFADIYFKNYFRVFGSGTDTERFYRGMVSMARYSNFVANGNFPITFGYLFRHIGISRLYAEYLIVLFSVVSIIFTTRAMEVLGAETVNKTIGVICISFLPIQVCMSSVLLRESLVYMFIAMCIYCFSIWYTTGKEAYFIMGLVCLLGSIAYHSGTIGVVVGIVIAHMIYDAKENEMKLSLRSVFVAILVLLAFLYLYNRYGEILFTKFKGIDSISDIADGTSWGDSSYAQYVGDSRTLLRMIVYSGPRIFYFLFSPLPWQWRGITDIIAFFMSSCFYIIVIFKSIRFVFNRQKFSCAVENRQIVGIFLLISLIAAFVFSWGTVNSGTAIRHRDKLACIYCVMISLESKMKEGVNQFEER